VVITVPLSAIARASCGPSASSRGNAPAAGIRQALTTPSVPASRASRATLEPDDRTASSSAASSTHSTASEQSTVRRSPHRSAVVPPVSRSSILGSVTRVSTRAAARPPKRDASQPSAKYSRPSASIARVAAVSQVVSARVMSLGGPGAIPGDDLASARVTV